MTNTVQLNVIRTGLVAITLLVLLAGWPAYAQSDVPGVSDAPGEPIGSGDGRIHIIPSLSAASIKNGDRASIQAVVKAVDGVAKVEARIERDDGAAFSESAPVGPISESDSLGQDGPGIIPCLQLDNLLGLPVATLELTGAPMNLGGVNAGATMGLWQAEWGAFGLEEGYYRVVLTVTDRTGHSYTDWSLMFSDPIAGKNTVGSTNYLHSGLRELEATGLLAGEPHLNCAAIDVSNGYVYFGTDESPGKVVKVALGTGATPPQRIGGITLNTGEDSPRTVVIDPSNGYAYFGTNTTPMKVVKVDVNPVRTFQRIDAITMNTGENSTKSSVIDVSNGYAYFGTLTNPGIIVKVDVNPVRTFQRIGAVTLNTGEYGISCAVIDVASGYAYFGSSTIPGQVVKVDVDPARTFQRIGAIALNTGEDLLSSAAIDTTNGYAYFGAYTFTTIVGIVVKVDINPSRTFQRIGAVQVPYVGDTRLDSAVMNSAAGYAYFGTYGTPGQVVKVLLGAGAAAPQCIGVLTLDGANENVLESAVIDVAAGYAYFGAYMVPGRVVKVALGAGANPPTKAAVLPLGDNNLISAVVDTSAGYAYFGTQTIPGCVVKVALGTGATPPQRIGSVTLNVGENYLRSAVIDTAAGYAYFGTSTQTTAYVVKVALGAGANPPQRIGAAAIEPWVRCGVIDPVNGYAYFGTDTDPAFVVKVALGTGTNPPVRIGSVALTPSVETYLRTAVISLIGPSAGYAYFGTGTNPAYVVKVALGVGAALPTRVGAVSTSGPLTSSVIDDVAGFAYFGTYTSPGAVVKILLLPGGAPPQLLGAVTLNTGENQLSSAVIDLAGYAYFGTDTSPGYVVKVDVSPSRSFQRLGAAMLNTGENQLYSAVIDLVASCGYFGTLTSPGCVVRVGLSQKGFLKATKFTMSENGSPSNVSFYSHAATGNVRLALYNNSADPVLLWQSGSTANTAANDWLTVPIANGTPSSLSLTAGMYWLGWQTDSAIPVPSYAVGSTGDGMLTPMVYGSCPASLQAGTSTARTLTNERWSEYITYVALPPNAPSDPGANTIGTTTLTWTWKDNSNNETGFKVYENPGAGPPTTLLTTTGANWQAWPCYSLTPNTQYAFQVAATNANGDSDKTPNYTKYTMAWLPSIGNNVTCDRTVATPYASGTIFTFTNPVEFGVGTHGGSFYRVSSFRYAWDTSPTYSFTGAEPVWNSGSHCENPTATDNYYLHLQSFNEEAVAGGTLNYGPFQIDGIAPTVTMMSWTCEPTNAIPIPVTVTFSEVVFGFTDTDIVATNGTVNNLRDVGGGVYAFDLMPSGNGSVTADIAAGVAQDTAGNGNEAALPFSRTYNSDLPDVVWFVDVSNDSGPWDGTSWAKAFNTIQAGVDAAFSGGCGEVWVAEGTYTGVSDPVVTMKSGVDLFGGFSGTESNRSERDWTAHITTIDGQYGWRCLLGANGATISGFTVTLGYAGGDTGQGGAMFNDAVSPTIEDCLFQDNSSRGQGTDPWITGNAQGGAIACVNGATPTLIRCRFASNAAYGGDDMSMSGGPGGYGYGGALYCSGGSPLLINCTFTSNMAQGGMGGMGMSGGGGMGGDGFGGALYCSGGSPLLINCTFTSNTAQGRMGGPNSMGPGGMGGNGLGGALYFSGGSLLLTNCTITSNNAQGGMGGTGMMLIWNEGSGQWEPTPMNGPDGISAGGGIYRESGSPVVTNCILWGDTPNDNEIFGGATVTYSCVQGGYGSEGDHNIADDPLFVGAPGNLRLGAGSPCINTGTSVGAPLTDIVGVSRPQETGFDMGAYEYYGPLMIVEPPASTTVLKGEPATFTVVVSGGCEPISYQWRWGDEDIEYENGSSYTIESAQEGNEGSYTVLVTDDRGTQRVSDPPAILTVTVLEGVPAAGLIGLAAAALATGLLGALRLRRRTR